MSVTFIIGPSGSGKSQFVYDSACKKAVNRSDSIKIMVPEQYTLETEKQIISKSRTGGLININVVSFNRLAYKGLNKIGGGNIPVIDEEVKNIFIRKIINEGKCALKIYNNSALKRGVTDELKSVISELLQYGIDSEKLKEASVKISDKKLSDKLSDISYIYDKFKESVTDNKSMTLEELIPGFTKRLSESDYMDDSIVYLDGYTGFTPAQYDLLRVIIKKAREVYITVTANEFESLRNAMSADSGNMSHNNIGDLF
ncbi:MAG: PD-(D/E)XK nuclease family protein, partial [Christensenellales bacterium]